MSDSACLSPSHGVVEKPRATSRGVDVAVLERRAVLEGRDGVQPLPARPTEDLARTTSRRALPEVDRPVGSDRRAVAQQTDDRRPRRLCFDSGSQIEAVDVAFVPGTSRPGSPISADLAGSCVRSMPGHGGDYATCARPEVGGNDGVPAGRVVDFTVKEPFSGDAGPPGPASLVRESRQHHDPVRFQLERGNRRTIAPD